MTVYVIRDGVLVEKTRQRKREALSFPTPMVSRMEPFESPVTGKEIGSWRERDADMRAVDAYDPRDLAPGHTMARGRAVQLKEKADG